MGAADHNLRTQCTHFRVARRVGGFVDGALDRLASAAEDLRRSKTAVTSFPPSRVALVDDARTAGASEGAIAAVLGLSLASVRKVISSLLDEEHHGLLDEALLGVCDDADPVAFRHRLDRR
jgi:hypothetical protein